MPCGDCAPADIDAIKTELCATRAQIEACCGALDARSAATYQAKFAALQVQLLVCLQQAPFDPPPGGGGGGLATDSTESSPTINNATSTLIMAANPSRLGGWVQNNTNAVVWLATGTVPTATVGNGTRLEIGGTYVIQHTRAMAAIAETVPVGTLNVTTLQ